MTYPSHADQRALAKARSTHPTVADLARSARKRIPHFAYAFLQGGAGADTGQATNHAALDAIQIVPRYGRDISALDTSVTLFGHRYAAPFGIAPVGLDGMMWPGATQHLARAAQALNLPYVVGMLASATIEEVMHLAPDVTWMQLYPMPRDDDALTRKMLARAQAAGVSNLVVTLDIPVRAKRPRDRRARLATPFRLRPATLLAGAMRPHWLLEMGMRGLPTFANMQGLSGMSGMNALGQFVQHEVGGGFTWDQLAMIRDLWSGRVLVKGVLHPADAATAVTIGMDGVVVSNHGGRQFDAAPAAINVLPAIAAEVASRCAILFDSGIRSGSDVAKAIACGADMALSGRGFMLALAALGRIGALHFGQSLLEEYKIAIGQCGVRATDDWRWVSLRHTDAWDASHFRI